MKKLFQWACDREKDHRLSILQQVGLFKGLRRNLLMKLLVDLVEKEYQQGDVIFSEGDPGKALYIILDGSVEIVKRCGSEDKVLVTLSAGSFFGELALIQESSRAVTARAETAAEVVMLARRDFLALLDLDPRVAAKITLAIARLLAMRVKAYSGRLREILLS